MGEKSKEDRKSLEAAEEAARRRTVKEQKEQERMQQEMCDKQKQVEDITKKIAKLCKQVREVDILEKKTPSSLTDGQKEKIKNGKKWTKEINEHKEKLTLLEVEVSTL